MDISLLRLTWLYRARKSSLDDLLFSHNSYDFCTFQIVSFVHNNIWYQCVTNIETVLCQTIYPLVRLLFIGSYSHVYIVYNACSYFIITVTEFGWHISMSRRINTCQLAKSVCNPVKCCFGIENTKYFHGEMYQ